MNKSSINVPLNENELGTIMMWVEKLRDLKSVSSWSDNDQKLVEKFEDHICALIEYND